MAMVERGGLMTFTSWSEGTWVSRWLSARALPTLEQQQLVQIEPCRGSPMTFLHTQDNAGLLQEPGLAA